MNCIFPISEKTTVKIPLNYAQVKLREQKDTDPSEH